MASLSRVKRPRWYRIRDLPPAAKRGLKRMYDPRVGTGGQVLYENISRLNGQLGTTSGVDTENPAWQWQEQNLGTNQATDPKDFSATSDWAGDGEFTISQVASIFDGEIGWEHENGGSSAARSRTQTIATLSASPETFYAVIENVDASITHIGIRDETSADWVVIGKLDWSTRSFTSTGSGAGSSPVATAHYLGTGPNGGDTYLLAVTGTADNPGNNRGVYIYPTGIPQNTDTTIIHYARHEDAGYKQIIGAPASPPMLLYDGSGDRVEIPEDAGITLNTPFEIMAVVDVLAGTGARTIWSLSKEGSASPIVHLTLTDLEVFNSVVVNSAATTFTAGGNTTISDGLHTVNIAFDGSTLKTIIDTTEETTTATPTGDISGVDVMTLGCIRGASETNFYDNEIGIVLLYRGRVLSPYERRSTHNWLRSSHYSGLPTPISLRTGPL